MQYPDLEMTKVAASFAVNPPENVTDAVVHSSMIAGMMLGMAHGKKEAGQLTPSDARIAHLVGGVCKSAARWVHTLDEKTAKYDPEEATSKVTKDFFETMMGDKLAYTKAGSLKLLDQHFDAIDDDFCVNTAEKFAQLFKEGDGEEEETNGPRYGEEARDDSDLEAGMENSMKKKKKMEAEMPSNEGHLEQGGDMNEANEGIVGEDALAEALRRINATTYSPADEAMEAEGGEENEMAEVARMLEAQQGGGLGPLLASLGLAGRSMQGGGGDQEQAPPMGPGPMGA